MDGEERTLFLTPDPAIEAAVLEIGGRLFSRMRARSGKRLFSRAGASARMMEWVMKDPALKNALFRFVDLLPSLGTGRSVFAHLREYLDGGTGGRHPWIDAALRLGAATPGLAGAAVRAQVTALARQFVAGVDGRDLQTRIRRNAARRIATTADLLGEAVVSEAEADRFQERALELLAAASAAAEERDGPEEQDPRFPRLNLSVKISALAPGIDPAAPETAIEAIKTRLRPLLREAARVNAFVNFDMETRRLKSLTLALFRSVFEEPEFRERPAAGIALQAYLAECGEDARSLIAWARERPERITGVRLVKGAYWDYEVVAARQRNWPVPVWLEKAESDAAYEALSLLLLENRDAVVPIFGTHNLRSAAHAIARAERLGVPREAYEFQALYGMADDLKEALAAGGHRVREYCPVGELLPGMAYLVRRLLENTSNEGFLHAARGGEPLETLLQNPVERLRGDEEASPPPAPAKPGAFANAPGSDLSRAETRARFAEALERTQASFGRRWPLVIGGKRIFTGREERSVNPARPAQEIGRWARATPAEADAAVAAARAAQKSWGQVPAEERASLLERVADRMEARRFELAALEICEAGKPWPEADADVSEAIDFCRFYAAEMRRLSPSPPRRTQPTPGEENTEDYLPRGVGVVIAPWNFPLAILCGMSAAPIVAGNAVILKPAEQTSILGAVLMELYEEAGLPPGVANLVMGDGAEVGSFLVDHPGVAFIAFTGSRAVGTQIWERAGRTAPGQPHLKTVVCEMGGKNALIIDESADLDEAIPAALHSAFSYAGQKCSALSRLIVLDAVYDRFVPRFVAAAAAVPVGDPARPETVVGPVINAEARAKIRSFIEQGKKEAKLAWIGPESGLPPDGFFVPPAIFVDVPREAAIAREEIFGPVVAIFRVRDLDEAFALANDSPYALTGGLFSRTPHALERARREFLAGNLYLNRGITGAIVERQPFGGFKMSGGGTKAGGRGYLQNFLFRRTVSENTLRRGFAPDANR